MPESDATTPIFDALRREFRDDPPDRKVIEGDIDVVREVTPSADEP